VDINQSVDFKRGDILIWRPGSHRAFKIHGVHPRKVIYMAGKKISYGYSWVYLADTDKMARVQNNRLTKEKLTATAITPADITKG
jgi:hypothetical protein